MEEILGQVMRRPIVLKDFASSYRNSFRTPYAQPCSDINVKDVMNISNDDNQKLQLNCSLKHLEQSDDPRIAEFVPGYSELPRKVTATIPVKQLKLKSYEVLRKSKQTKKPSAFKRSRESFTMLKLPSIDKNSVHNLQPCDEIKLYVRFYRPTRATHNGQTLEKPVFSQEFVCLGRNFLTELRDQIHCVCNNKLIFDISDDPEATLPKKTEDPGYFFITDTFYNDTRNPQNMDYSLTVRNWAKKAKGLSTLNFKVAKMEETRFIDLTISLGFPQLYQHHGNCEHVFVFSNIELITNPSAQILTPLSNYPCILTINRFNTRTCNICGRVNYVFVVEGSNRQLQDPAYLCKQCFMSFHYINGKKIGEFRAYRLNDELQITDKNMDENVNGNKDDNTLTEENFNVSYDNNEEINNVELFYNHSEISEEIDITLKEERNFNIEVD